MSADFDPVLAAMFDACDGAADDTNVDTYSVELPETQYGVKRKLNSKGVISTKSASFKEAVSSATEGTKLSAKGEWQGKKRNSSKDLYAHEAMKIGAKYGLTEAEGSNSIPAEEVSVE